MKFGTSGIATVLNVKENEMNDGRKFYKMAIEQDGEAGSISCTEEVFKTSIEKYKDYALHVIYDDKYSSLKCVGIQAYSRSK